MHKYVLRRHLKGAVDAVIATKRMGSSRLMGLFASASETPTSGAATEATPAAEAPAAASAAPNQPFRRDASDASSSTANECVLCE